MERVVRKALLIGVGESPGVEQYLRPLSAAVDADLRAMSAALRGSDYAVEVLRDPTRNAITERITALSAEAPPGSILLLYFTGHGVRIGDTDYLVPADARAPAADAPAGGAGAAADAPTETAGAAGAASVPTRAPADRWDQPHVRESLLGADISKYLGRCRADTVLWLIDACRSAAGGGDGRDGGETAFGSRVVEGPPNARFAMMTGCAPGERSGFADTGSFFSLALAHAFDPLTEATTVEQVYGVARREARTLARRARAEPQRVLVRYGSDLEAECRGRQVAQGRRLLETWREAVRTPALWQHVPASDAETVARLQDCLGALAGDVARHVHRAQERLPDPWADDDFPVRLLRDRLPMVLPKDAELSALEVTALIAGVLLHEAAWAERLSQAAELHPHRTDRRSDADAQRRHYEQIAEQHPQVTEKLGGWHWWRTGPSDDRNAVMLWLVHRWIGERFATDEEAVPAAWADAFVTRLLQPQVAPTGSGVPAGEGAGQDGAAGRASAPSPLSGRAGQLSLALRTVAAGLALGAPPDEQRLALPDRHVLPASPDSPAGQATCKSPQRLRVRPLAALLRLAGLLALDARRLPEVLAEHLAVSDPVVPRDVITVFRDATWDLEQDGAAPAYLHLDAVCPHPSIHAALASVVEDADEFGHALKEAAARLPADDAALLRSVPARLTDHRLRPDEVDGFSAYDIPLAHFSLAQTEIRRLLMGEQLYDGKRSLALRELYQNALDACRYREMRVRYLRGCGKEPRPWAGHIRISTGRDERGPYVECLDNGVGMTVDQLRNTFTRAGRRFDQSHAFRREQATWLRHDRALRLYPNSRFGIGVFSYFMLADEMTVVTRPVGPDGRPARRALRVDIPVSGSLFRVQEADEREGAVLPEGGTRVRLHLREPGALSGDACLATLKSLVLYSEFRLEVGGGDGDGERQTHVWAPRSLQAGGGAFEVGAESALEAVPGVLWWVPDDGAIVCDGIVSDQRTFGYVLNLTGAHAGRLSVNRNKLEGYDFRWKYRQIRRGAAALAASPGLSLPWLRSMESRNPAIARILWQEWRGKGVRALADFGRTVDLDEVGWFKLDAFLGGRVPRRYEDDWVKGAVRPWRNAVLGSGGGLGGFSGPGGARGPGDPGGPGGMGGPGGPGGPSGLGDPAGSDTPGRTDGPSGPTAPSHPTTQREAVPLSLEGHPVPGPGWSDIASGVHGDWRNAVRLANVHKMTVSEAVRAARGLRIAHPRLAAPAVYAPHPPPPPPADALHAPPGDDLEWRPGFLDLEIVAGLLGPDPHPMDASPGPVLGRRSASRDSGREIYYRHAPDDLSGIVRTSAKWRRTLGELADECAKFAPFLATAPPSAPAHHQEYVCTDDDLALLYLKVDKHSWRPTTTPWDVRAAAERIGCAPADARRRLADFDWLRPVPDPVLTSRWAAVPDDLFPVLWRYVVADDEGGAALPWAATVALAAEHELPLRKAERILAEQARLLGLRHRRRYRKGAPGRHEVPSPEAGDLTHWLHDAGVRLEDGVSLRDLAYVQPHQMSRVELSWYADELRAAGVDTPDAAPLLEAWDDLPTPSRYAFSGMDPALDAADYPVPATSAVLFVASQQLREKLSYLWRTARQEAKRLGLGPELIAPALPKGLKKFSPTSDETAALVEYGWEEDSDYEWCESPVWTPLTARHLVAYARARHLGVRAAFEALAPLRAIGALVPELSAEAVAALPDGVPGPHDVAVVDPGHRVSAAGTPLVPLDLVSLAGRLGEPVRDTWRRLAPYLPLEGTAAAFSGLPDTVPRWQDLAILSERLDGRLPALAGPVDRERLTVCAAAVGETPAWVRARLTTYAGLFGIEPPPPGDPDSPEGPADPADPEDQPPPAAPENDAPENGAR